MIAPPRFASQREHIARIADAGFWSPYVAEILARHDLTAAGQQPLAGFNATYPTFLCGDLVVKLFGNSPWWRESHAAERAALALIAKDPLIAAPRLLAAGRLYDDDAACWPYLISTRIAGVAWRGAGLSSEQRRALAVELGGQIRRIQALPASGSVAVAEWSALDVTAAARRSSLPPHLIAQIDGYLGRLGPLDPLDRVFVHADLVGAHVFVEDGHISGIIDWGDALLADRHYEIIQLYRDLFACDKTLLRVFLEASEWPLDEDFPDKALAFALYRQAAGLAQHHTMDVFQPIAALLPLHAIGTLDELADELFAV